VPLKLKQNARARIKGRPTRSSYPPGCRKLLFGVEARRTAEIRAFDDEKPITIDK